MADIRFYHLTRKTAEQALPELVSRAYAKGHKIVIRSGDEGTTQHLNDLLWTYNPDMFLPHGSAKDGRAAQQPIYLTSGADNPAGADVLMLMPGADPGGAGNFALCCQLINGADEHQTAAARTLWKAWKEEGHAITYWQQSDQGKWEQKA